MSGRIDAIFENGVFRPEVPVNIANGERVSLDIERTKRETCDAKSSSSPRARIHSPRLANPDQASDFTMEVREVTDAGL